MVHILYSVPGYSISGTDLLRISVRSLSPLVSSQCVAYSSILTLYIKLFMSHGTVT